MSDRFYPQGLPRHGVLVQLPGQPGGTPLAQWFLVTRLSPRLIVPYLC